MERQVSKPSPLTWPKTTHWTTQNIRKAIGTLGIIVNVITSAIPTVMKSTLAMMNTTNEGLTNATTITSPTHILVHVAVSDQDETRTEMWISAMSGMERDVK